MLHPDWPEGLPRERCMSRPGIILYGYDPSDEVRFGRFKPVMTLKTVVSMIKEMQPGQCASYGRRFTAEKMCIRDSRIPGQSRSADGTGRAYYHSRCLRRRSQSRRPAGSRCV